MKRTIFLATLAALLPALAGAAVNVVTSTPDLAAIARAVGGDLVKVTSLARGTEDPHHVDIKPSFIRTLNQADLLVEGGAELEIGWLPPLVESARNRRIVRGGAGWFVASEGLQLLDVPAGRVDRSQGDVHAAGNPHYLLDPLNGRLVAGRLTAKLAQLDPMHAAGFQANLKAFESRLDEKMKEWNRLLAPHKGTKVLTYHKSFDYFAARFGFVVAGQIEPKPGLEPSPGYVNSLIPQMKAAGVKVVLTEPNRPRGTYENIARLLGIKSAVLPIMPGGMPRTDEYLAMCEFNVLAVAAALQ